MNYDPANPGMPFFAIGIDIGGTKIAAGVVRFPEGRIITTRKIPSPVREGAEAVLSASHSLASELAESSRAHGRTIHALGIGLCEIVDPTGHPRSSNLVDWTGLPVRERMRGIAPTVIEADVRAAALAEAEFGAGKDLRIFLFVTIGTGISSCLVVGRRPFAGAKGATGTFATSPLPSGPEPGGSMASIEESSSGPALVDRLAAKGVVVESAQDALTAAANGNETAIAVVTSAGTTLGAGIGWLVNVLDPEAVILGGSLGLAQGLYRDSLLNGMRKQIWWPGHRDVRVLDASAGPDAGLLGAATTAWHRVGPTLAAFRI